MTKITLRRASTVLRTYTVVIECPTCHEYIVCDMTQAFVTDDILVRCPACKKKSLVSVFETLNQIN